MQTTREIKFVTSEVNEKDAKGHTRYQGQLRHNTVYSEKETRQMFAKFCNQHEPLTNMYLDMLSAFIVQHIREGNRLDFGPFAVGLKLRGSFASANAPFNPQEHSLGVELMPTKVIRKAVLNLKPVNTSLSENWRICGVYSGLKTEYRNLIHACGEKRVTLTGYFPEIRESRGDEGIWLENDNGTIIGVAQDLKSSFGHADFALAGGLPCGEQWVVVQGRYKNEPQLIRVNHRVTVVE